MFRFTIRDLLWLTVVAAISCGWLIDHRKLPSGELQRLRI
jgi:hypothetical protein